MEQYEHSSKHLRFCFMEDVKPWELGKTWKCSKKYKYIVFCWAIHYLCIQQTLISKVTYNRKHKQFVTEQAIFIAYRFIRKLGNKLEQNARGSGRFSSNKKLLSLFCFSIDCHSSYLNLIVRGRLKRLCKLNQIVFSRTESSSPSETAWWVTAQRTGEVFLRDP